MSDLIDSDSKAIYASVLGDLFDTFARTVTFTVYKKETEQILYLENAYDGSWDEKKPWADSTSSFTENKASYPVRMWYLDYEQQVKSLFFEGKSLENVKSDRRIQKIKIQVKDDAFEFIKNSVKCYFLGEYWNITSSEKSVGLFDFQFHIFLLERAD